MLKRQNTWKDMFVLELEELVFEKMSILLKKFLKIQGDFNDFHKTHYPL